MSLNEDLNGELHRTAFINQNNSNNSGNKKGPSKISSIVTVIFTVIFVLNVAFDYLDSDDYDYDYDYEYNYETVTTDYYDNFIDGESAVLTPIGEYITDGTYEQYYDSISDDLNNSLATIHTETGIIPHVFFVDYSIALGDMYAFAKNTYYELFDDEDHLLLCIATDGFEYAFETIFGDNLWSKLTSHDLNDMDKIIETGILNSAAGDFNALADKLAVALEIIDEDYFLPLEEDVSDKFYDENVTELGPGEEIIPEDDTLISLPISEVIGKIATRKNIITVLAIAILVAIVVIAVIISRRHNNYEPDNYSIHSLDDYYEKEFKKKESKYDSYMK